MEPTRGHSQTQDNARCIRPDKRDQYTSARKAVHVRTRDMPVHSTNLYPLPSKPNSNSHFHASVHILSRVCMCVNVFCVSANGLGNAVCFSQVIFLPAYLGPTAQVTSCWLISSDRICTRCPNQNSCPRAARILGWMPRLHASRLCRSKTQLLADAYSCDRRTIVNHPEALGEHHPDGDKDQGSSFLHPTTAWARIWASCLRSP